MVVEQVEEFATQVKLENQVCCLLTFVCFVCVVACYFFEKCDCMSAVFQKTKGANYRHSRFEPHNESTVMRKYKL